MESNIGHLDAGLPGPAAHWNLEFFKEHGDLWFREIREVPSPSRVVVDGLGDVILLGGYSYLGLNGHPRINAAARAAIDEYGTGTTGARFLTGSLSLHGRLEREIAAFKRTESAIILTQGFVTNIATISALTREGDVIFSDQLNHASIIDGCRSSKARCVRFTHLDLADLESKLRACDARFKLVVVDAVFSMDGDIADLPGISELCKRYGAFLFVDEAHSTGVLGETGRGIEEHFGLPPSTIDIKMGTLSKAIPASGGYIAGSKALCDFLRTTARAFTFSGSMAPPTAAAALAAIRVIREEPERVKRLQENFTRFSARLRDHGLDVMGGGTPIVPVHCGSDVKACELAAYCGKRGIFIHAVFAPIVPPGRARLRASITAAHTESELDYCAETIARGARELGIV